MSDLVVCVPRDIWFEWIAEGDAAGTPLTGEEWGYSCGRRRPPIDAGERLYIVSHGRLRGYAPVTRVTSDRYYEHWLICREAGAEAVTVPGLEIERVSPKARPGFRGWRERWWDRSEEVSFPDWQWEGVEMPCGVGQCKPRAIGIEPMWRGDVRMGYHVSKMACASCAARIRAE